MNGLLKYFNKEELEHLKIMDLYSKSEVLVRKLFEGKTDKEGKPYVNHLLRVSGKMTSIDGKVAGLLHDVVEDIEGVSFEDLSCLGIPDNIIEALKLVTKEETTKNLTKQQKLQKYNGEIDKIIESKNLLALELKIADMRDNYDLNRLKNLPEEKQNWFKEKYEKNLEKLRKAREKYDRH